MSLVKKNNRFAIPSIFDDLFLNDRLDVWGTERSQVPAANIKETETDFKVELAAPGLEKEDFNISVEEDVLTISSEKKHSSETQDENERFTRREFTYSSFSRSFTLPDEVKHDEISAAYADGVLIISVPKNTEAQLTRKRTIAIS